MNTIVALWLPIVVSAVFVFIASSLIHMVLPWHKNDYSTMPNETQVRDALRPFAIPPGDYMVPRPATRDELRTPEFAARVNEGPNLVLTVLPNMPWMMGRTMGFWFLYCLVVSVLSACVAAAALNGTFELHAVFHFVAMTAFIGYVIALWQLVIWYRRSIATTVKSTIDGIIYAVVTGLTFMWLWPK